VPKKPLLETNPYLRDPNQRNKALITNVASSTAVETGRKSETIARTLRAERDSPVKTRRGSGQ
jgi:hypothetical protein